MEPPERTTAGVSVLGGPEINARLSMVGDDNGVCQEIPTAITQYSHSRNGRDIMCPELECNDKVVRILLMQMPRRKWLAAAACFGVIAPSTFSEQADNRLAGIKRI